MHSNQYTDIRILLIRMKLLIVHNLKDKKYNLSFLICFHTYNITIFYKKFYKKFSNTFLLIVIGDLSVSHLRASVDRSVGEVRPKKHRTQHASPERDYGRYDYGRHLRSPSPDQGRQSPSRGRVSPGYYDSPGRKSPQPRYEYDENGRRSPSKGRASPNGRVDRYDRPPSRGKESQYRDAPERDGRDSPQIDRRDGRYSPQRDPRDGRYSPQRDARDGRKSPHRDSQGRRSPQRSSVENGRTSPLRVSYEMGMNIL